MSYLNNKPHQLQKIRKETQDKLYARQPQLMEKLILFINRANILIPKKTGLMKVRGKIQTEPFMRSKRTGLVRSKKKQRLKNITQTELIKRINSQRNNLKKNKVNRTGITKISQIPVEIIWGLK